MIRKVLSTAVVLLIAASFGARAQYSADVIGGYNFSPDRRYASFTLSSYGQDSFGDTFARADLNFAADHSSLASAYLEVARTLNFWKGTSVEGLGVHAEFNGFLYMGNSNWLFGLDYTLPVKDLFKLSIMYKTFNGSARSKVPVQLSLLWDMKDLGNVRGLEFRGQAKAWGETTDYWYGDSVPVLTGSSKKDTAYFTVKATPQIWYAVGQFFGWDGLSLGGELELSYNYLGCRGFHARPFAALRFSF